MKKPLLTLALATLSLGTQAEDLTLSGQAVHHNDRIVIDFSVTAGSSVSLWTDSWQSGLNFDPQLYLAHGGVIVGADNDGGSGLNAAAGYFDAGLQFIASQPGSYRLVLNASSNDALGATLAQGFAYDADLPIRLADWNQPGYDINANDQKGGFWRVHLSGVTQAAVVPEPAGWALLLPGLLALGVIRRRPRR